MCRSVCAFATKTIDGFISSLIYCISLLNPNRIKYHFKNYIMAAADLQQVSTALQHIDFNTAGERNAIIADGQWQTLLAIGRSSEE